VTKLRREDDRHLVDLEIWATDQRDRTTTKGVAHVRLPSRTAA